MCQSLKLTVERLHDYRRQLADAAKRELARFKREVDRRNKSNKYLRDSEIDSMVEPLVKEVTGFLDENCPIQVKEHLDTKGRDLLRQLETLKDPDSLRKKFQSNNAKYVKEQAGKLTAAGENRNLTAEQARAVATDEDVTLVLAGAGTGKTSVIIEKIAHLVRDLEVEPSSILALAFNKDAAAEIRHRLPEDLKEAEIRTFHAFGGSVIASQEGAPTISKMGEDDIYVYKKTVDEILEDLMRHSSLGPKIIDLMASMPAKYRHPFDFKDEWEYRKYILKTELRSLNRDRVKSFEELMIANFLTENGIKFTYEEHYKDNTKTTKRHQYRPDFYLIDYEIYIEHFALDRNGKAPEGWFSYKEGVDWKRKLHKTHRTTLIETFTWEHQEKVLLSSLRTKLESHSVEFNPISRAELIQELGQEKISLLADLLCTFLHHVKSGNHEREDLELRAAQTGNTDRNKAFLEVFYAVYEKYQEKLEQEDDLDFHDLINDAVRHIKSGKWQNPYEYVLVDEFQDISSGRMELLKALKRDGLAFFLVGDDWQSIYRFTGSRVDLVTDCDQHLGHKERVDLTQTFRFGQGILAPSSKFIMKNREQSSRKLSPNKDIVDRGITILLAEGPDIGLKRAMEDLTKSGDYAGDDSVLVLGRYKRSVAALDILPPEVKERVTFSTIHRAKGREADYVMIVDLEAAKMGFPCKIEDDDVLDLVLPPVESESPPFAEERRLFYVALTRAKKGVYLIADKNSPSSFVRELVEEHGEFVRQLDQLPPQCPRCTDGAMTKFTDKEVRCSNNPNCDYTLPIGGTTGRQYVLTANARASAKACIICEDGVLIKRMNNTDGTTFWGCSNFGGEPSCTYTCQGRRQNIPLWRRESVPPG